MLAQHDAALGWSYDMQQMIHKHRAYHVSINDIGEIDNSTLNSFKRLGMSPRNFVRKLGTLHFQIAVPTQRANQLLFGYPNCHPPTTNKQVRVSTYLIRGQVKELSIIRFAEAGVGFIDHVGWTLMVS